MFNGYLSNIHTNKPKLLNILQKKMHCYTCDKMTNHIMVDHEWYGFLTTCIKCGEQWNDGERCERPLEKGWREKNIKHVLEVYKNYKNKNKQVQNKRRKIK